ncbi:MAG: histidine ammonia-lyase [Actinobacteria bacterium]|nr:MAG: histidine ammonia-lyase [Actinomycetota bacterium]
MSSTVVIGIPGLSPTDVVAIARHGAKVEISTQARSAMEASRATVDQLAASPTPAYGISTGFGALATKHIDPEMRAQLQRSLIRSHAAGSGEPVESEVVRAMMALRLSTMCTGRTGIRATTADTYAALLNAHITPLVREYGSLGCSGDLAPLSTCALAVMGEGEVRLEDGTVVDAAHALNGAGITPVEFVAKEGLALINGTDGMLGMLIMAINDIDALLKTVDISTAMSIEALLGTDQVFAEELHELRPQLGQGLSAKNLRRLLGESPLVKSHAGHDDTRVQDAYSLRCAPQVAGAARDTVDHARLIASRELASVIDNPVVLPDGRVRSNGNFHGAPVAYVLDFLAIVIADVASMSERRTDRMLDKSRSFGLNPFLADDPGVDSGLMIAQYTQAGLVSEMKRLASPASVDSIPSSAMQEDHVSMGWHAGRKLRRAVDAFARVIAIEIMAAGRAIDMRTPLLPSLGTGAALKVLRAKVQGPGTDRWLTPEIEATVEMVKSQALLMAVEREIGELV